jgi:hypothetical protein
LLTAALAPLSVAQKLGPFSDWSEPVNVGPPINSEFNERFPTISDDGLRLYFASDRPGGFGGPGKLDIYVSHRSGLDDPWGEPQNLGPVINASGSTTHSQNFSRDGHWMLFTSTRTGGCGRLDMWISFRQNTEDDFAWETPMNLGCAVNSEWDDACPFLFEDEEMGVTKLYFVSNRPNPIGKMNVYESTVDANGSFGTPVLVEEVSSSEQDLHFAPRRDGLEAFIWSTRLGGFGLGDIWVSRRESTADAWSTPVNLGPTVNTEFQEQMPSLSSDGTELYFPSDRPGGYGGGGFDIYVSRRRALPQISGMPTPGCSLWPPNHGLVEVATISASGVDAPLASMNVTGTSNEPADPGPDIVISGSGLDPYMVQLRAERLGAGTGRIYTLTATATDLAGNTATTTATCVVPHDQGH